MAPPKSSRNHDDSKSDAVVSGTKEKSASAATSTKMRRVASQTSASQNREPPAAAPTSVPLPTTTEAAAPSLSWPTFDRDVLHAYRREHHLNTPTSFASSYHQTLLSRPGSIGLYSPTMARKRHPRRQSKDRLALAVRKHFNGMGVQENDVIVDFIYKLRTENAAKNTVPPRKLLDLEQ